MTMEGEPREELLRAWLQLPEDVRSPPATDQELHAFEERWGPIPEPYRWFLSTCGGGPAGADWLDDIGELERSHVKHQREMGPPRGWRQAMFVIGWDGCGDPVGLEAGTGRVLIEYHDVGEVTVLADSFEAFLRARLLPQDLASREFGHG